MATEVAPIVETQGTGQWRMIEYGKDEFGPKFALLQPDGSLYYKARAKTIYHEGTHPPKVKMEVPDIVRTFNEHDAKQHVSQFNAELEAATQAAKDAATAERVKGLVTDALLKDAEVKTGKRG